MALNTYTENEEKIIEIESVDYAIAKKTITPGDGEEIIDKLYSRISVIMGQSVNRTNY
jgi:hypothetical protein